MYYLSSTTNIILTINLMVVFALLIFIFYRIIKKESKSYKKRKALSINDIVRYKVLYKFLKFQTYKNADIEKYTLLLVSIDNFETVGKYVNKNLESVYLKKIASLLRMNLPLHGKMAQTKDRPSFLIYLPNVNGDEIINLIKKFKTSAEKKVSLTDSISISKTISIAYTTYPDHCEDLDGLLNNLKLTLLQLRRRNGNLIMSYDKGLKEFNPERFEILKNAIKNDEMKLYYYPIYDPNNKEIYGSEVIVNWDNKGSGISTLRDLLFFAETSNDEYWLGLWVFEKMLEAHINLFKVLETKEYYTLMQMSIKIFDNDDIVEVLERITRKYYIEPRRIVFQIVNPIEANSSIKLMKNIIELERLGFKFCIEVNKIENRLKAIINEYMVSFVKISKDLISSKNADVLDLEAYLHDNNIEIIATDIKDMSEANNLINRVGYLQGGLEDFPCKKDELLSLVTKYRRSL